MKLGKKNKDSDSYIQNEAQGYDNTALDDYSNSELDDFSDDFAFETIEDGESGQEQSDSSEVTEAYNDDLDTEVVDESYTEDSEIFRHLAASHLLLYTVHVSIHNTGHDCFFEDFDRLTGTISTNLC